MAGSSLKVSEHVTTPGSETGCVLGVKGWVLHQRRLNSIMLVVVVAVLFSSPLPTEAVNLTLFKQEQCECNCSIFSCINRC